VQFPAPRLPTQPRPLAPEEQHLALPAVVSPRASELVSPAPTLAAVARARALVEAVQVRVLGEAVQAQVSAEASPALPQVAPTQAPASPEQHLALPLGRVHTHRVGEER
jgi:hypothetical protein